MKCRERTEGEEVEPDLYACSSGLWQSRVVEQLKSVLGTSKDEKPELTFGLSKILQRAPSDQRLRVKHLIREVLRRMARDGVLAKVSLRNVMHRGRRVSEIFVKPGHRCRDWILARGKRLQNANRAHRPQGHRQGMRVADGCCWPMRKDL